MTDPNPLSLALYQPDIPQNAGAVARLAACFDVGFEIIEPCGFLLDDTRIRRVGMDYLTLAPPRRHLSWDAFLQDCARVGRRVVLLSTQGAVRLSDFAFAPGDRLLLGRESAGVPDAVHGAVADRVCIPLQPAARSLNVASAAAIALGAALNQLDLFPETPP